VETVDPAVFVDLPAVRRAGDQAAVGRLDDQSFVEVAQDVGGGHTLGPVGVQGLHLGAVAAAQHLLRAGGDLEGEDRQQEKEQQAAHLRRPDHSVRITVRVWPGRSRLLASRFQRIRSCTRTPNRRAMR
jgi:hypothetical protein